MTRRILYLILAFVFSWSCVASVEAADRLVPASYPTINQAMDVAINGDRILVAPGTYSGMISFQGKLVELIAQGGPEVTFLDGSGTFDSVVVMDYVGIGARLSGFSIQNGFGTDCGDPAAPCGGGVLVLEGEPIIEDCIFSQNTSSRGGAIYAENSALTVIDCSFNGNFANQGGALSIMGGNATITNCDFDQNTSYGWGGGFVADSAWVTMSSCNFTANVSESGGGFFITESTAFLDDCIVENNSAVDSGGGGVVDEFSSVEITSSQFLGNTARLGGGLSVTHFCVANIEDCLLQNNVALEYGGGLYSFENFANYRRNRILDNSAGLKGGGALVRIFADPLFENCLILNNEAGVSGGGLACIEGASTRLVHCTIDSNSSAGTGGGISAENLSTPVLVNTIVSRNVASSNTQLYADSQSGYLFQHVVIQGGDQNDPLVLEMDAALDDSGYPGPCSAAIDEATSLYPDLPAIDIDGTARPLGVRSDIGAFEVAGYGHCFLRGDCNANGDLDLGDAVMSLGYLFSGGEVTQCIEACDYAGDGLVGIEDSISTLNYLFLGGSTPPAPYPLLEPAVDPLLIESCWILEP
ncbi:MAG: right-handed parallel beta-helix repeat-containing protein [Planctomycetota bacterium]